MSAISSSREFYRDHCTDPKKVAQHILGTIPVGDIKSFQPNEIMALERLFTLRQEYAQNPTVSTLARLVDLAAHVIRINHLNYETPNEKFLSPLRYRLSRYFPNLDVYGNKTKNFCQNLNTTDWVEIVTKKLRNRFVDLPGELEGDPILFSGRKYPASREAGFYLEMGGNQLAVIPYQEVSHIRLCDPSDQSPFPLPATERAQAGAIVKTHLLRPLADITLSCLRNPLDLQDQENLCARLEGFV